MSTKNSALEKANSNIIRPRGLPKAKTTISIPVPEHKHLPAWVRRTHGQAAPILADQTAILDDEAKAELQQSIEEITQKINLGKFSAAWQYSAVISQAQAKIEAQLQAKQSAFRQKRSMEDNKRKITNQLKEAATMLPNEANSRLRRALGSANGAESLAEVGAEVHKTIEAAKAAQDRRRDRESRRTRDKIMRSIPYANTASTTPDWQEVLRKLAAEQESND